MFGVHNHGTCLVLKVADFVFGNTDLEMSVDATKGKPLALPCKISFEDVFSESIIVAMILTYDNIERGSRAFNGMFGCKDFKGTNRFLHMQICEPTVVISEGDDADVPHLE